MILPHTAAEILANYFVLRGWAGWPDSIADWKISHNKLPDLPDQNLAIPWISIFDRRADEQGSKMRTGERAEFWGWQVLVRGKTDDASKIKMIQIATALDSLYMVSIAVPTPTPSTTYTIQRVRRTIQPLFLKQEERANMRIWTMEGYVSIYIEGT